LAPFKLAAHHNTYDTTASLAIVNALFPDDIKIVPNSTLTNQQSLNRAKSNLTAKRNKSTELQHSFLQELKEWIAMRKTPADTDPAAAQMHQQATPPIHQIPTHSQHSQALASRPSYESARHHHRVNA
jgi:hypothetical protein